MTRREFSAVLAGGAVAISLATGTPREGLVELRIYRGAGPGLAKHLAAIFPRAGIHPLVQATDGPDLAYLIPFQSLSARHGAWTQLNTDPEWIGERPRFESYHFALYRAE